MRRRLIHDGLIASEFVSEPGGSLSVHTTQPSQPLVLEAASRIRAEHPPRALDWGRWELSIPWHTSAHAPDILGLYDLYKKYPELKAPDKQIQLKAWHRFIRSAESKPYRVR